MYFEIIGGLSEIEVIAEAARSGPAATPETLWRAPLA
jgi:hypothetical protein